MCKRGSSKVLREHEKAFNWSVSKTKIKQEKPSKFLLQMGRKISISGANLMDKKFVVERLN